MKMFAFFSFFNMASKSLAQVPLLIITLLIASCSAYRIEPLSIDGKEIYQLSSGDCATSLRVNHIGTIDNLHLLLRALLVNKLAIYPVIAFIATALEFLGELANDAL